MYSTATVCNKPGDESGNCYPLDPGMDNCYFHVWVFQSFKVQKIASEDTINIVKNILKTSSEDTINIVKNIHTENLLTLSVLCCSDLTEIMATSDDWEELVWAWQGWRESSSRAMPPLFTEFVELQNDAADLNGKQNTHIKNIHMVKMCLYHNVTINTDMELTNWTIQVILIGLYLPKKNYLH